LPSPFWGGCCGPAAWSESLSRTRRATRGFACERKWRRRGCCWSGRAAPARAAEGCLRLQLLACTVEVGEPDETLLPASYLRGAASPGARSAGDAGGLAAEAGPGSRAACTAQPGEGPARSPQAGPEVADAQPEAGQQPGAPSADQLAERVSRLRVEAAPAGGEAKAHAKASAAGGEAADAGAGSDHDRVHSACPPHGAKVRRSRAIICCLGARATRRGVCAPPASARAARRLCAGSVWCRGGCARAGVRCSMARWRLAISGCYGRCAAARARRACLLQRMAWRGCSGSRRT